MTLTSIRERSHLHLNVKHVITIHPYQNDYDRMEKRTTKI